ncbi:Mpv17/PMP22 [Trinorchestia longiramus]|nr:Mpv17/PMP22 [Trinorchestia longiramus]
MVSSRSLIVIIFPRFLVTGTFITAPTVYVWVKIASKLVKGNSFKHALLKALYDITLFAPVGQSQFYFSITALEGRPLRDCLNEVKQKLIPSWKVAACFWPIVQTLNFAYVKERNRVMVVSVGSFVWTMFLSYMHHTDGQSLPTFLRPNKKYTEP